MKYLNILIFIPLFLFAGEVDRQLRSSDVFPVSSESSSQIYGKSYVYEYAVEPLVSLDEEWGHIVTHCSIMGEDLSQGIRTYDGLGSCVFEQVEMLSDEEELRKSVVFHVQAGGQLFNLLFRWEGLSLQDILHSYLRNNPRRLSSRITLNLLSDEQSLSDFLSYLILSEVFKTPSSEDQNIFQTTSSFLLQKKIDFIHLRLSPYLKGLLKVTLSFIDSDDVEFYTLDIITNYYVGAEEYFVTSIDQYQEESNEE